jgi:hypothetical protein
MRGRHCGIGPAAVAALAVASVALAGCGFALPPKKKPHPTFASDPAAVRLADAPALLVQCAIRTAGLRPGSQSWLSDLSVHVTSTNAIDFQNWFRTHDAPGPYPQTFVIDGHRTAYLAFGARWVNRGGRWVPAHTARDNPLTERTSLYAWSLWAADHDRLPAVVCGPSADARQLQAEVFGSTVPNPW